MIRLVMATVVALCGSGCRSGTYLDVELDGPRTLVISSLDVTVTNAGETARNRFSAGALFVLPQSFALRIPEGRSGTAHVRVVALGGQEALGEVEGDVGLVPGATATLRLTLLGGADMGSPDDPELTEARPPRGPTAGGVPVTLRGKHFAPGVTITFNKITAQEVKWVSSSEVVATLPAAPGAFGPVELSATNPGGRSGKNAKIFNYYASMLDMAPAKFIATAQGPHWIGAADFDGDRIPDLVFTDAMGVRFLKGKGDGGFEPLSGTRFNDFPVWFGAIGDFDNDLKLDLAMGGRNSMVLLKGRGDGVFDAQKVVTLKADAYTIAAADLDGDQNLDVVLPKPSTDTISILLGDGKGGFSFERETDAPGYPVAVAAGDLNADRIVDVVVASQIGNLLLPLLGTGGGTFKPPMPIQLPPDAYQLALSDFNGDGLLDAAVTQIAPGVVSVAFGDGKGAFPKYLSVPMGLPVYGIVVADFDGDGAPDLAVAGVSNNKASFALGRGDGTFTAPVHFFAGDTPGNIALSDFNGDGRVDVAVVDQIGDGISVLINASK